MSEHSPQLSATLRQQAEQQLNTGNTKLQTAFTASADALGVLYRLSSAANTASDGLKLLHELQIHQIELDLQLEQLQNNEHELNHELACYQQFFAMNPTACLILNLDGVITDNNAAATHLFSHLTEPGSESDPEQLCGRSLLSLLCASCRPLCSAVLARVQRNQQPATLLVRAATGPDGNPSKAAMDSVADVNNLRLSINLSSDHKAILIMLT